MADDHRELARAALAEITPAHTVGAYLGTRDEAEYVVSYLWASAQPGYPDWQWTVTVVSLPGDEPSVLELELLPTESSVLAPEWVPWSVRLAEYRAAQQAAAEARAAAGEPEPDEDDVILTDEDLVEDNLDDDDDDAGEDELDDDENDIDDDDEDDDESVDEEDIDEFGDADDDDRHGITLPGEDDD